MDVLTADTYMVITFIIAFLLSCIPSWASDAPVESNQQTETREESKSNYFFLDYVNWQQEGTIKAAGFHNKFIVTNKGLCAGGAASRIKNSYRTFIDGCLISGYGNTGSEKSTITYKQSDISLYGLKTSFGIGRFISPAQAELGLKIPIMYIHQNFSEPLGATIHDPSIWMVLVSLYSRWPFGDYFVQTEFAKFIGNDLVMFQLGAGVNF
jgi:hypothetical protein